eukprot:TRINITY_DN1309_c0_g1_i1.p1 TRINITY_DN1309_c0_g1~~TRINITY_DN1309_c0_g1_i1.p1  ORF type:complete len:562 (+),score=78.35 TRINITY_DN1309_c0_g1_i1:50-1687(+)
MYPKDLNAIPESTWIKTNSECSYFSATYQLRMTGSRRDAERAMLTCVKCGESKDSLQILSECIVPYPGDTRFSFLCACCNKGKPLVTHLQKSWVQIGLTVFHNLHLATGDVHFPEGDIQKFLKRNQGRLGVNMEGNWRTFLTEMNRSDLVEKHGGNWSLRGEHHHDVESDDKYRDDDEGYGEEPKEPKIKETKKPEGRRGSDSTKIFEWCHQCKQKHFHVFHCVQGCNKKYCGKCLQRHYDEKESEIDPETWVCVYCRDMCTCASCRKRKAKDTNTKFESRRGKKRSMRAMHRNGKRRRLDPTTDSSSVVDDSDDFVEDDEEDYEEEESYVTSSPVVSSTVVSTPTVSTPRALSSSNARTKRVTLKTLIDAGLLVDGDKMFFKKSADFSGILLPDGQIACDDHICPSLSTFAKYAASELNTKWSRQNGWRLVFCRSMCLYDLRKEYLERTSELVMPERDVTEEVVIRTPLRNSTRSCVKNISNMYEEQADDFGIYEYEEPSEDSHVGDCSMPPLPSLHEAIQVTLNALLGINTHSGCTKLQLAEV